LGASAAGAGEAVQLCYRWQQGETLHYVGRVDIEGLALGPEGIRTSVLSLSMNMPISFHVVAAEANGTARVAVRFGELKLGLGLLGQKLDVTVTGRDISAFFNGTALPASELAELRRELVPLQALIREGVHLVTNEWGQVLRCSVPSGLGVQGESELGSLVESFELPQQPLRVGDRFVVTRPLSGGFAAPHMSNLP